MNYRRIDFKNSCNNEETDKILFEISRYHNMVPKIWRENHELSKEDIEETMDKILDTNSEDLFITIAEDEYGVMQGFIWASKQNQSDSVMILSLYVSENHRNFGIATNLKELLEEWCLSEKIKTIHTNVHCKNNSMLELNKKLGYTQGMIYMTKNLD